MDYTSLFRSCQEEIQHKFSPKKEDSLSLSEQYRRISSKKDTPFYLAEKIYKRSLVVADCGSYLEFNIYHDESSKSHKLAKANFCKDRLCPMCAWRRSLKVFGQLSQLVDSLSSDYEFVFLTLTVVNVKASELSVTIDKLYETWRNIRKSRFYKESYHGDVRVLEITHNKQRDDYHPHLHIILAVNPSYFSSKFYKSQKQWVRFWQEAYGDPTITQVFIQSFRRRKKGVAETAKYTVKCKNLTDSAVLTFFDVLCGRRLISFSGVFYKQRQLLKLEDPIDGDLVHVDDISNPAVAESIVRFKWGIGVGYYEIKTGELVDNYSSDFRSM